MRNHVKLTQIPNVVTGTRSHVSLPRGLTYDYVIMKLTNCVASDLENFKTTVNTKNIIEISDAGKLDDISDYYGRPKLAGYFILWFYRPEMATEEERAVFSLGTRDIGSFTLQWDLKSGLTSPAIELYALQRGPSVMGTVAKIRELPKSFGTSGEQVINDIQLTGDRIGAIHLHKAAGDVSNISLDINVGNGPSRLIDMPKDVLEVVQKLHERVPQTALYTHIDATLLGKIGEPIPTRGIQEMLIKPTLTTGGQTTAIVEYFGGHAGA